MGIDPASLCQLRCPLCPTGVENEARKNGNPVNFRNRSFMTVEMFDSLLGELKEYLFLIMFYNWGEPLLNKDVPKMISKAKKHDIYAEMHSNLSLPLSEEFIQELLESGIDEIAASIDGFSAGSYQTYRRGGDFELANSNIERLARMRDRLGLKTNIIWNFLVFSFNEHEVELARAHCESVGITFNPRDAFVGDPEWLPSYRKDEQKLNLNLADPEPVDAPSSGKPKSCAWHYNYSIVNANGSVSPCCAPWDQEHDFGTVDPGVLAFADIWNNNAYRKSRGAFAHKSVAGLEKLETLCTQCPYDENMQNLYSHLDKDVVKQFRRTLASSEPTLAQAFDLLGDKMKFVQFYRNNLLVESGIETPILAQNGTPTPLDALLQAGHKIKRKIAKLNMR
jgi:MoaA/NifB/PqqE/SkfB family radical SAM enzyme